MKDLLCDEFQNSIEDVLTRHKSILDIITKLQEATSKVNRAVVKSVTTCGCISINASKQNIPADVNFEESKNYMHNHLDGTLCESCREKINEELGNNIFYLAALANTLDINLYGTIINKSNELKTLGKYSLY